MANFSKSLSKEVAQHGIRVNTVSPGPVSTALWLGKEDVAQTVAAQTVAAAMGGDRAFHHSRRGGGPHADPASQRAGNITGADFTIDGGLIKTL